MQDTDQQEQQPQLPPAAGQGQERTADAPQAQQDETPEIIQNALKDLIRRVERESDVVRRHHVRRFLEAEEMWKGNQHLIWSDRQFRWHTPFEYALEQGASSSLPRYQYVTNIYQSFGLSIIAAISQKLPKVRFLPKSATSERDRATAKAASDIAELIEDNNCLDLLSVRMAYLLWTQGIFGSYVRYVLDKEYGTHDVPVVSYAPVEVAPDRYVCSTCHAETPVADVAGTSGLTGITCPQCGYPMDASNFAPQEMGEGVVVTGTQTYPNGQEVISIIGGLNLKLMPFATSLKESGYLIWVEEHHEAALRAAYPKKANKIGRNSGSGGTAENEFEKNSRLSLADSPPYQRSAQPQSSMITYTRGWLRNWMLWAIEDEDIRNQCLELYPDGVRVDLAGDEFLEAIPEDVDKHWEVCAPMPGQGIYRESIGGSTISIQKRLNDSDNVIAEHIEFGSAPPVLFDARFINREALANRRMEPASFMPVMINGAPAGADISKMIYQPNIHLDANIYGYGKDLIEMTQMVSGAMPSIFGGSIQNVDTASGYSMAREQSLGKLNLFWRAVKQFQARLMLKAVECFKENRTEDYEMVVTDKSNDFVAKWIHLEDIRGGITAKPESDEDFPATWAEIRENIMTLVQQMPDAMSPILMDPANSAMMRKFIANPDLVIPGEDDQEKQYREIDLLLQGQVIMPQPDPATGMMGQPQPSIQPDILCDNHMVHIKTIQEFAVSDKGIEAKQSNPGGYANLMAHFMSHVQSAAQQTMIMSQMQPQPQPAPGAGAPGPNQGGGGGQTEDTQGGATIGDQIEQAVPGAGQAIEGLMNAKVQ